MQRQLVVGLVVALGIFAGTLAVTKPKSMCVKYQEVPEYNKYVYFVPNITVSAYIAEGICAMLGGQVLNISSVAEFNVVSKLSDRYGRNEEAYYWIDFNTTALKMERSFECSYISYKNREAYWGNGDCSSGTLLVACEIKK